MRNRGQVAFDVIFVDFRGLLYVHCKAFLVNSDFYCKRFIWLKLLVLICLGLYYMFGIWIICASNINYAVMSENSILWFCRQHFLQCAQGLLIKHFEKLIQCDTRLNFLSQQPEIMLDSPHFDARPSACEDPDNLKDHDLHQVNGKGSAKSCFQDMGSPHASLSPSFKIEHNDLPSISLDSLPREAPSPSSGIIKTWPLFWFPYPLALLFHSSKVHFSPLPPLPSEREEGVDV